jgi:hypothetical protein
LSLKALLVGSILLASTIALAASLPLAYAAPDFTISANPSSVAGPSLTSSITLTSLGGFSGNVNVSATVNPPGPSISLTRVITSTSVILNLPSGGTVSNPLFASSRISGNFTITVTGVSGSLSHSVNVTFVAQPLPTDFSVDCCFASGNGYMGRVAAGGNYSSWAWVASINGFAGPVNLTITLNLNTSIVIRPSTVDVPSDGTATPTITFLVPNSTRPGDYTGTLTSTNRSITHTRSLSLTVDPAPPSCPSCIPSSWSLVGALSGTVLAGSVLIDVVIEKPKFDPSIKRAVKAVLLVSSLSSVGVLLTLASGLVLVSQGWVGLTCIHYSNYGFPFSWRELLGCGRQQSLQLDWSSFTIDVLFYAASGYFLVIGYEAWRHGWKLKPSLVFLVAVGYVTGVIGLFILATYGSPLPMLAAFLSVALLYIAREVQKETRKPTDERYLGKT